MGCCGNDTESTVKKSVLVFKRENLLRDISNLGYIEGHIMGDDEQESKHMVQDIIERQSGGLGRVNRLLWVVYKAVIELLYPYTKREEVCEAVTDDRLTPKEYIIRLNLPADYSDTSLHMLSVMIHEYMVYRVLYDWLSMMKPKSAEQWKLKLEEVKAEIIKLKNRRMAGLRRPLHPF